MTQPSQAAESEETVRWRRQYGVVLVLLLGFAALVVAMIWIADSKDIVWLRRVYVFGVVEAIVFTAVGWLFGKEVNRSALATAQADADAARTEAADARAQARDDASRADRADSALDAIRAAATATTGGDGGGISDVGDSGGSSLDLRTFIEELLKQPRR